MKVYRIKHKPSGLYWSQFRARLVDDGYRDVGVIWKKLPIIPDSVTIITKHEKGKAYFVFAKYPKEEFEIIYDEIKD